MSISIAEFQTAMDIFGARRLPDKEATRSIALVPCYIVKDTILFHSGTDYIVQENPDYVSFNRAKQKLELEEGETSQDGKFSLDSTRCVGACGLAPVFTVNNEVYGKATVKKFDEVIDEYMKKD